MRNNTVLQSIKTYALETPDKLAVVDVRQELTYNEFWDRICGAAEFMSSKGVIKGEAIIIKTTQTVEYLVICHAVQLVGAMFIPLEKSVNEGRIQEIISETNCTRIFGDIEIDGANVYGLEEVYGHPSTDKEWDMPNVDDESMILFTTGTTGKSKGIVLEYSAEYAVAENVMYGVEMKKDNVEIIPMPMNHSYSLRRYFANMINGSTVIVIDGVFFIKVLFEMIEKYNATAIAMAPAAMSIILKLSKNKIAEYKNQLDYLQFGGSSQSEVEKEYLRSILPNTRLYNIYGSTEMGCACILNFNSADNMPNCIGHPTYNSTFCIVDEEGKEIDGTESNPGFLAYAGAMGMKCYYKDEELTKKTIVNGYLQSRDLGYKDGQGRIFMLGRTDDIIITGANKVSPLEVEEEAKRTPGVIDCICKGKKDALMGAVPVLYIVVDEKYDEHVLEEHLLNVLEDYKRPRMIQVIEVVPRTYNGKIDRKTEII